MKDDPPIIMLDEPTDQRGDITFDNVMGYLSAFLAGFGLAAFIMVCWLAGLYYGSKA